MAKIKQPPQQPDEGEQWLLSYADMMTLIACFFILLVAFANYDPVGFSKKTKIVAKHFNKDKSKSSMTKMETMSDEISKHPEIIKRLKVTVNDNSLRLVFSGSVLFKRGFISLEDNELATLDSLIDIIKSIDPSFRILIEGHTDSSSETKVAGVRSNWALGSARSSFIAERFEYFGFNPQKIIPVSYGDARPLAPNFDKLGRAIKENMKLNRRIVIKVLEPLDKLKKYKLGLGAFFLDGSGTE